MKMVGMKMRSVSPVPGNKTSTRTPVKRGSTGDRTTTPASKRSGNRGASGTSTRRGSPVAVAKARPAMRRSKSLSPPKMKKKGIASVISSAAVRPKLSTKMTSRTTSTLSATTTAARTSPSSMKSTPPSSPWSGAKMKTPSVRNAAAAPAAAMKKEKLLAAAPSSSSSSSTKNANSRLNKQVVKTAVKIVRRRSMPATTGGADGKSNKISSSRSSVGKKQTPTSTSKKERVSEGGDGSCINKGHSAPSSSGAVAPASTNRDDTDWSASSTTASTPSSSTRGAAAAGTFIGNGNATNISAFLVNTSGRQEPQQDPASVFAPATHTAHLTSSSSSSSSSSQLGGGSLCQFRPRGILKKVSSSGSAGNTSSRAKVDEHHRLEHDKVPGTTSTMPPTTGSTSSSGTRAFKSEVQDLADTFAAKLALPPTNANLMLVEDSQTLHEDAADPRATHKIKINSQRKQKHATWKQSLLDDVGGAGLLQASGSSCSSSSLRNDAGERTAGPRAASVDRNQEIRMSQLEELDDEDGHHAPDRNREITISELFDEETRGWAGSNAASSSAANRNDHPKKPKVGDTSHDPHTFSPENKNRQRKSVRFAQMPAERHTYEDVYDEGFFMGRRTWFQSPYEHQKTQMEFLLLSSPEEWEKSSMYVANQKKRREKFRQLTGMGVGGDHDCWAPTSNCTLDDVDDELHPGQVLEHDAPANNLNFDEIEDADEEDEGEERDHEGGYYDVDAPRSRNSSRSPEPRDRTTGASMGSAASSQVEMAEPTPFTPEQRPAGSSSSSSRSRNVGGGPGASSLSDYAYWTPPRTQVRGGSRSRSQPTDEASQSATAGAADANGTKLAAGRERAGAVPELFRPIAGTRRRRRWTRSITGVDVLVDAVQRVSS